MASQNFDTSLFQNLTLKHPPSSSIKQERMHRLLPMLSGSLKSENELNVSTSFNSSLGKF